MNFFRGQMEKPTGHKKNLLSSNRKKKKKMIIQKSEITYVN
jgi:hypothetical protein